MSRRDCPDCPVASPADRDASAADGAGPTRGTTGLDDDPATGPEQAWVRAPREHWHAAVASTDGRYATACGVPVPRGRQTTVVADRGAASGARGPLCPACRACRACPTGRAQSGDTLGRRARPTGLDRRARIARQGRDGGHPGDVVLVVAGPRPRAYHARAAHPERAAPDCPGLQRSDHPPRPTSRQDARRRLLVPCRSCVLGAARR